MGEFHPWLVLVPVVGCPLVSRLLSGDREFRDVYSDPAPLQPPGWVFGPVWTVLYAMLGYSLALAYEGGNGIASGASRGMIVMLVINVLWTPLFLRRYVRASLVLLIVMIFQAAWVARGSENLRALLIPYILWLCFAATLNAHYAGRN